MKCQKIARYSVLKGLCVCVCVMCWCTKIDKPNKSVALAFFNLKIIIKIKMK